MHNGDKPLEIVNPAKPWTPDDPKDPEDVKEAMHKIREQVEAIENRGKEQPGPTGRHPEGELAPGDLGEIKIQVGIKQDTVIINFGTNVAWVGLNANQAIDLGNMLIKSARRISRKGH